jgi:hypothetical protein
MRDELYINGTLVNLSQAVGASLNFAIADIRDPDKRNGAFSRTVKLYKDKVLSEVLDAVFEIGYNTQTSGIINFTPDFNPNLKVPFVLYTDGVEQLRGYMRLRSIDRDQQQLGKIFYNVELYGTLTNIFTDLGDKKLTDLDYSSDNHTYDRTNQRATWSNVDSDDGNYVYPMINYGITSEATWDVKDFFPAISLRSLVEKIVTGVGYTWDSTFLDSSYFKKLFVPYCGDKLTLSSSGVANSLFKARSSAFVSGNLAAQNFPFDLEVSDPSSQYNPTTYTFTAAESGWHEFIITGDVGFINITASTITNWTGNVYWVIYKNNISIGSTTNTGNIYFGSIASWATLTYNVTFTTPSLLLQTGDQITFRMFGGVVTSNLNSFRTYAGSGVTVFNTRNNPVVVEGSTIDMNAVLPIDIRQADFLKWVISRFNLMVEPDRTNEKLLYIDPPDDFFGSVTSEDWTDKVDVSKPVTITPMGLLEAIRYVVKDSDDNDYWNKFYRERWNKTFGEYTLDVTNDFIKSVKVIETGFAPCPILSNSSHDRIIPHIYQVQNNGNRSPMKTKPRILYWGGALTTNTAWTYQTVSSNFTETTYPYMGHVDDPYTPTLDVNIGVPREIFYVNPRGITQYTDNNVYNNYHYSYMNEITNANSKLVSIHLLLTPLDILNLSFRRVIHIDGHNYRLHKIVDYSTNQIKSTKVELLRLATGIPFTPATNKNLDFTYGGTLGGLPAPSFNWGSTGSTAVVTNVVNVGRDNYIAEDSTGTTVSGSGNRVGSGTSNITIQDSSDIIVLPTLQNVTVINSSNLVIEESDVVYINNVRQQGTGTTTLTANTTLTQSGYYLANGTFTITLSPSDYASGTVIDIKDITSGAHTITISGGGVNIDGSATYTMTVQYESVTILYNGTQFYLI